MARCALHAQVDAPPDFTAFSGFLDLLLKVEVIM